jgi:ParB-like chromosome segregation protein Spo0J
VNLADKIVMRPIGALIPYASNARTHSDAQIAQIAASIREFGFTDPILVDGKQGIIAGHGRVLAARKLGMDLIPTIELAYSPKPSVRPTSSPTTSSRRTRAGTPRCCVSNSAT